MSTPEERYIPGASTSYGPTPDVDKCFDCEEETCYCCNRATNCPCCEVCLCVPCILKNTFKCCNECDNVIVGCPNCDEEYALKPKELNKYLHMVKIPKERYMSLLVSVK